MENDSHVGNYLDTTVDDMAHSLTISVGEPETNASGELSSSEQLPEGWSYGRIGGVAVRSKPMERLTREQYVKREVASSLELGDPRTWEEIEAAVLQELAFRAQQR